MIERHHSCRGLRFSKMSWARNPLASNSFLLKLLSDPHPLNPAVSISCRNGGGGCTRSRRSRPKPFTINTYTTVPPAAANKRLTPRLSPLDARFTKTQGVGVVTDNQKLTREPVAHPFRGEVSVCRPASQSLLSACGWRQRTGFQSVRPSRWASVPGSRPLAPRRRGRNAAVDRAPIGSSCHPWLRRRRSSRLSST